MTYAMSNTALLEPALELGLRFDGDTGMGMEMGLGATFANTAMGLSADGRARFLVFHGDDGVAESGFSLLLLYDPGGAGGLGYPSPRSGARRRASPMRCGTRASGHVSSPSILCREACS